MGFEITLSFKRGEFVRLRNMFKALSPRQLRNAHSLVLRRWVEAYARMVKQGYAKADYDISALTVAAYANPPSGSGRPRRIRPRSLKRTYALSRAVKVSKTPHGYRIALDGGPGYDSLDPATAGHGWSPQEVGQQMENPRPVLIKVTKKMMKYIMVLLQDLHGNQGNSGHQGTGQFKVGATILVQPTPRPVWAVAYKFMMKRLGPYLSKDLHAYIRMSMDTKAHVIKL